MIRNRLAILLAERDLTATKVYEETKISKSTLSSLVNNSGDGVQYKTLDKLCSYLEVTPSEFFDYSPFILEYDLKIADYRKGLDNFELQKNFLITLGHSEEQAIYLASDDMDVFGDTRYIVEILATKGQKKYKYSMSIDIFKAGSNEDSNAPKDFDVDCILVDEYEDKSFVNDIYNHVSITFQTQIKNECFKLIKNSLSELIAYATVKGRELKIYIQTPFGDTETTVKPNPKKLEEISKKYGEPIINNWITGNDV